MSHTVALVDARFRGHDEVEGEASLPRDTEVCHSFPTAVRLRGHGEKYFSFDQLL
jgi:hypothetical protein